jgi:Na+-transporting methylmalonyl-CoA/oxaloacetate decarboxylase gamma subunit
MLLLAQRKVGRTVPNCVPEQVSPVKSTPHAQTSSKQTHQRQSEIKKSVHTHKPRLGISEQKN